MTSENEKLTTEQQVKYIVIGFMIAVVYVFIFLAVTHDFDSSTELILPTAFAQVQPFELQLEQIRNPLDCTRKTFTSAGAYLPFTLKIFYDTTQDRKWDVISKAQTFPVAQQTAQVATFFTSEVDQYELYLEVNYERPAKRQAYIEILSEGKTVANWQEKFDDQKFCMTFLIQTNHAPTFPTREELIGDLLTNVDQIPEMIKSFNANTITWSSSISYMWTLIFGSIVVSVLTLIGTGVVNRNVKSKMGDVDDALNLVDSSAKKIDEVVDPLNDIIERQNIIIENQAKILSKSPETNQMVEKKSKFGKLRKKKPNVSDKNVKALKKKKKGWFGFLRKDKEEEVYDDDIVDTGANSKIEVPPRKTKEENKKLVSAIEQIEKDEYLEHRPRTESDEVKEALQMTPEDLEEERKQEPSGGFVLVEDDEKKIPEQVLKPEPKPPKFKEVLRSIDFENLEFKQGTFHNFTYNELNNIYSWIIHYKNRKQQNNEWQDIPEKVRTQQDIAGKIIYHAIMAKLEKKMKDD